MPDVESLDRLRSLFVIGQVALGAFFIGVFIRSRSRARSSGFRSDSAKAGSAKKGHARGFSDPAKDPLAQAKLSPKAAPPRLSGIRVDAAAHEILGVALSAKETEIRAAYRELMKRYHPDKIGRPGTREWADAQKIAEAINRAKDEMLARLKK